MLRKEQIEGISRLVSEGLSHKSLIGERYSDKLIGSVELLEEAVDVLNEI